MQLGLLPDVSRRLLDFVEGMQQEDGSFANFPKTTVKTTMVRNGRMSAQAAPITVCL